MNESSLMKEAVDSINNAIRTLGRIESSRKARGVLGNPEITDPRCSLSGIKEELEYTLSAMINKERSDLRKEYSSKIKNGESLSPDDMDAIAELLENR